MSQLKLWEGKPAVCGRWLQSPRSLPSPVASLVVYLTKLRRPGGTGLGRPLSELADSLAAAVMEQWTRAALERRLVQPEPIPVRWGRSSRPLAGPVSAAVGSRQFPPLPGLPAAAAGRLRGGQLQDLHAVYGGLGSGRLVVIGGPGSGKSGAAVLLILAALNYRAQTTEEERQLVPVPVLVTLHGWDPSTERVGHWLAVRLQQTYPLFAGKGGLETLPRRCPPARCTAHRRACLPVPARPAAGSPGRGALRCHARTIARFLHRKRSQCCATV